MKFEWDSQNKIPDGQELLSLGNFLRLGAKLEYRGVRPLSQTKNFGECNFPLYEEFVCVKLWPGGSYSPDSPVYLLA